MTENKKRKWALATASLIGLVAIASLISLCAGSAGIHPADIPGILLKGHGTAERSILLDIRLPRLILGLAVGGSLGLAGALLQGIFRNPLVEPYTLGISGGASLGVCANIILNLHDTLGMLAYPASGFMGAAAVVFLVYGLNRKPGAMKSGGMLLTGVMISYVSSSAVMLLMAVSGNDDLRDIVFWIMGSLDEPSPFLIRASVWVSLAGLAASFFFCLDLNALALGEEEAEHLGVHAARTRKRVFVIASVMTGLSVSVAGVIMFAGLIVPHFMRIIIGSDHRILLVGSFLAGASFLALCDVIARTIISPLELPVGVITGIIGGTVFIWALYRKGSEMS
ncbi:Iron complex transport system permease protein [Candidatus Desulfarcum epimagneticum]|uniref:Iron complex transport system permease protein n=1 Tax=uncultured Desulfobacteraceae bacterium TaxID=218296 RepID=A0A484HLZ2_9BACT|nr:Iron complex transport system permease protein [uncultured Desulfobacteraceae bacterium]